MFSLPSRGGAARIWSRRSRIRCAGFMARISRARRAMAVNCRIYGEGEALLGWLNCTVQLAAAIAFSADDFLKVLACEVQTRLKAQSAEVAHLKMTFSPDSGLGEIAVVNLVRN